MAFNNISGTSLRVPNAEGTGKLQVELQETIFHGDSIKDFRGENVLGAKSVMGKRKELVGTNSADVAQAVDWRKLFTTFSNQSLQFFPPTESEGSITVKPPGEVFEEGVHSWQNSVVAQFIGKTPNFSSFHKLANIFWGKEGAIEIKSAGPNLYIIQPPNAAIGDWILEHGPWHIQNKPLILRKWEPRLKSLEFDMKRLPVWIHLKGIPLELYTQKGLSYIASALGIPLYMDRITANQQRLAFAKVCVEIASDTVLPRSINVEMRDGTSIPIIVEIPWSFQRCKHCSTFGHMEKACPSKPVGVTKTQNEERVWIPKDKNPKPLNEQNVLNEQGRIVLVQNVMNEQKVLNEQERTALVQNVHNEQGSYLSREALVQTEQGREASAQMINSKDKLERVQQNMDSNIMLSIKPKIN